MKFWDRIKNLFPKPKPKPIRRPSLRKFWGHLLRPWTWNKKRIKVEKEKNENKI